MIITDAQVHVWPPNRPDRPWNEGAEEYAHRGTGSLEVGELLSEMDAAGVDRALLVSPTWEGYRNDYVLEAVSTHPDRFGAIVRFDLSEKDVEQVREWNADPRVVGARTVFVKHTLDWLREGVADWFWPLAEELGMPLMVYAPYQYDGVREVAQRHPGLRLAICHFGMDTKLRDAEIVPQVDELVKLAELPNVAVKASSLPSFVTDQYPFSSLHGQIERVVDAFGPERVFWGSDLSRLRCTYQELVDLFVDELKFLDDEDRRLVMGEALADWFGWQPAT